MPPEFILPDSLGTIDAAPTSSGGGFTLPDSLGSIDDIAESNSANSLVNTLLQGAKHTGAGAVEGISGLAGFLADNLSLSPSQGNIGTRLAAKYRSVTSGRPEEEILKDLPKGTSQQLREITDATLPAEDEDYRYPRRIGQFLGPTAATGGLAGGGSAALKSIFQAITGASAGQYTEDQGGGEMAQLAASIFGGMAPDLISGGAKLARNAVQGPTAQETLGSAAKVQRDFTKLTPQQIDDAAAIAARDKLGLAQRSTTAEMTNNAGMAQIEKALGGRPEFTNEYAAAQAARDTARKSILDGMTKSQGVGKAALGEDLTKAAGKNKAALKGAASEKWEALPSIKIDTTSAADDIAAAIPKADPAELGFSPKIQTLINKINNPPEEGFTSEAVQGLRSQALKIQRSFNPDSNAADVLILPKIEKSLQKAMDDGFGEIDAVNYAAARQATAVEKSIFGKKTVGAKLIDPKLDPEKALKVYTGTKRSAEELKIAANLKKNPALADKVNRSLLDDMRGNPGKPLTPAKIRNYLSKNEEGMKVLLGKEHVKNIHKVADDLDSQYGLQERSFGASTGGSITAQKQSVAEAIKSAISGSTMPGSGLVGKAANEIKKTVGVDAEAKIAEHLFNAAMNPQFAKELAGTASRVRVMNWLERLKQLVKNDLPAAGGKAALADTMRPNDVAKPATVFKPAPAPVEQKKEIVPEAAMKPASYSADDDFSLALKAIEHIESRGNKNAVSPKGAIGTHQVMPIAMRDVMRAKGVNDKIYSDAQLRQMAAEEGASEYYGTEYVKLLYERFNGDWPLIFAAYNGGPSLVKKLLKDSGGSSYQDIAKRLPTETRNYVPAVQATLKRLMKA